MPVKLIYHTTDSTTDVSPFDKAIVEMVKDQDIKIACPYLGLSYLQRIFGLCNSWRILTDVEELLTSYHSIAARDEILQFLGRYSDSIHHCKDLHAKMIVTNNKALVGSANFTDMGITRRTEISVLFEQEAQVAELNQWFDNLWLQTTSVNVSEAEAYAHSLPSETTPRRSQVEITSRANPIRAQLVKLTSRKKILLPTIPDEEAESRLVERVKFAPNREWMNTYFELLREVIITTGLTNDDARLVTSIPGSPWFLPVTINNRYVLAPRREDKDVIVGIIFSAEFEIRPDLQALTEIAWRFSPLRGESINTPFFLRFDDINVITSDRDIREGWLNAIQAEVKRARSSTFRKFHQPVVYQAAINLDYREKIFGKAFE